MERRRQSWGGIAAALICGILWLVVFCISAKPSYESGGFWGSRFQSRIMGLLISIAFLSEGIAAIIRRAKGAGCRDSVKNKYVYANWVTIAAYVIFGTEFAIAFGRTVFASGAAEESAGTMDILCMVTGVIAVAAGIVLGILKLRRRNVKTEGGSGG